MTTLDGPLSKPVTRLLAVVGTEINRNRPSEVKIKLCLYKFRFEDSSPKRIHRKIRGIKTPLDNVSLVHLLWFRLSRSRTSFSLRRLRAVRGFRGRMRRAQEGGSRYCWVIIEEWLLRSDSYLHSSITTTIKLHVFSTCSSLAHRSDRLGAHTLSNPTPH